MHSSGRAPEGCPFPASPQNSPHGRQRCPAGDPVPKAVAETQPARVAWAPLGGSPSVPCLAMPPGGVWGVPSSSGSTSPKREREGFFRADIFPSKIFCSRGRTLILPALVTWAHTRHVGTSAAERRAGLPGRACVGWPSAAHRVPRAPSLSPEHRLGWSPVSLSDTVRLWRSSVAPSPEFRPPQEAGQPGLSARCGGAGGRGGLQRPLGPAGSSPCACGGRGRPGAS